MKVNCWEFKKCGREAGGKLAAALGACPAAVDARLHGTHGGTNCGRACWVVAGTLCGGRMQGGFGEKFENCRECAFYTQVKTEEGTKCTLTFVLLNKIENAMPETAR